MQNVIGETVSREYVQNPVLSALFSTFMCSFSINLKNYFVPTRNKIKRKHELDTMKVFSTQMGIKSRKI